MRPAIDSSTWCWTPVRRSASSRLRVERLKNATASSRSVAAQLDASTTASAPVSASTSPSAVYMSTPPDRLIPTVSWPPRSSAPIVRRPMRPVAPTTATRMVWAPLRGRSYPGSAGDDRAGRLLEHAVELVARGHAELREHLVQVILHGARRQEHAGADLGIAHPVTRHPGDLGLLRGEPAFAP